MNRTSLVDLACGDCARPHDAGRLQTLCEACGKPLLARYDLSAARRALTPEALATRPFDLWRYREVLPVSGDPVTLGEGGTPILPVPRLAAHLGLRRLWVKDEGVNPTGSFKARGLAVAVSMARELGARRLALPTAGNAGLAAAAYAAAAGLSLDIFCPADTPAPFIEASRLLGAKVTLVPGVITDCAARLQEHTAEAGWFDLSTLREPYRVEGKKTMAYEVFEQLGRRLPDVMVYPTGGGTGLVGMWKALAEMEEMGWIGKDRPRLVAVQAEGCAPIVRAFAAGEMTARPWENAATLASGLRVPAARGDFLILRALRASRGTAVAVPDAAMVEGAGLLGRLGGILAAPEGGALVAALADLVRRHEIEPGERVVLFNTGVAFPYLDGMGATQS